MYLFIYYQSSQITAIANSTEVHSTAISVVFAYVSTTVSSAYICNPIPWHDATTVAGERFSLLQGLQLRSGCSLIDLGTGKHLDAELNLSSARRDRQTLHLLTGNSRAPKTGCDTHKCTHIQTHTKQSYTHIVWSLSQAVLASFHESEWEWHTDFPVIQNYCFVFLCRASSVLYTHWHLLVVWWRVNGLTKQAVDKKKKGSPNIFIITEDLFHYIFWCFSSVQYLFVDTFLFSISSIYMSFCF